MVEEYQPDVVMTDIKMPYMDGIELAGRIRTEYPATKILFFTGFDDFEYAKEAVHLEAEEYILKPVNSVEMTNVFYADEDKAGSGDQRKKKYGNPSAVLFGIAAPFFRQIFIQR